MIPKGISKPHFLIAHPAGQAIIDTLPIQPVATVLHGKGIKAKTVVKFAYGIVKGKIPLKPVRTKPVFGKCPGDLFMP